MHNLIKGWINGRKNFQVNSTYLFAHSFTRILLEREKNSFGEIQKKQENILHAWNSFMSSVNLLTRSQFKTWRKCLPYRNVEGFLVRNVLILDFWNKSCGVHCRLSVEPHLHPIARFEIGLHPRAPNWRKARGSLFSSDKRLMLCDNLKWFAAPLRMSKIWILKGY